MSKKTKYFWPVSIVILLIALMAKNKILLFVWDVKSQIRIDKLHPAIQRSVTGFINAIEQRLKIKLRVTDGFRTFDEQAALYAQGRTTPGKIVTWAEAGESYHNYGLAFDCVEIKDGKANYNVDYSALAVIAKEFGLTWGGNFPGSKKIDLDHFENRFGFNVVELKERYLSGNVIADGYVNLA